MNAVCVQDIFGSCLSVDNNPDSESGNSNGTPVPAIISVLVVVILQCWLFNNVALSLVT